MKCFTVFLAVILVQMLVGLLAFPVFADETDLNNGVLIAHHPPGIQYTDPAPPEGWCQHYHDNFTINCCHEQNPRIDTDPGEGSVWYVLSAWDEDKEFCGVEFGFASYDAGIYGFVEWDACPAPGGNCLLLTCGDWPGPDAGVAIVVCGDPYLPWTGNFVPVCWFAGYAYAEGVVPLGPNPTGYVVAGWGNCEWPTEGFETTCLGALGILTDGIECCPEGGPSPAQGTTWGALRILYR